MSMVKKMVFIGGILSLLLVGLLGLGMEKKRKDFLKTLRYHNLPSGYWKGIEIALLKGSQGKGWKTESLGGYLIPLPRQDDSRHGALVREEKEGFVVTYFGRDKKALLAFGFYTEKPYPLTKTLWFDLFTADISPSFWDGLWWRRGHLQKKEQITSLRSRLFPIEGKALFFYPTSPQNPGLISFASKREGIRKEMLFLRRKNSFDLLRLVFFSEDADALAIRSIILNHLKPLEKSLFKEPREEKKSPAPPPLLKSSSGSWFKPSSATLEEKRQENILFWD